MCPPGGCVCPPEGCARRPGVVCAARGVCVPPGGCVCPPGVGAKARRTPPARGLPRPMLIDCLDRSPLGAVGVLPNFLPEKVPRYVPGGWAPLREHGVKAPLVIRGVRERELLSRRGTDLLPSLGCSSSLKHLQMFISKIYFCSCSSLSSQVTEEFLMHPCCVLFSLLSRTMCHFALQSLSQQLLTFPLDVVNIMQLGLFLFLKPTSPLFLCSHPFAGSKGLGPAVFPLLALKPTLPPPPAPSRQPWDTQSCVLPASSPAHTEACPTPPRCPRGYPRS